jgi:peptidoglycan/LPS O-acetylase OafA/YrhL
MSGKTDPGRLAFLDAGRAVAAALVFVEHALHVCVPPFGEWSARHEFHLGRLGVLLFLTISGFIIPHSLQQGGSNARFWLRRLFRLFPAYWVCVLIAFLYARLGGQYNYVAPGDFRGWLMNLTMLQGFFGYPHAQQVFWTLQIELVLYATCSVLHSVRLLRHARWLLAVLAAAVFVGGTSVAWRLRTPLILNHELLFAAPMVGFVAHDLLNARGRRLVSIGLLAALVLVPLRIHLFNYWCLLPEHAAHFTWDYCVHYLTAYLLFFTLAALRDRQMHWSVTRLGRISYSIYLMHPQLLILVMGRGWSPLLCLPGLAAATVLLAEACYRFVEEPGIALGRLIEGRRSRRSPPPVPAEQRQAA